MMNFFSKCFEAICNILIVLNFLLFAGVGGYLGYYISPSEPMMMILCGIGGLAISFFVNVFVFGFIGQITEIRRNLEELNNK